MRKTRLALVGMVALILGLWILIPTVLERGILKSKTGYPILAAEIGVIRGDLWSRAATSRGASSLSESETASVTASSPQEGGPLQSTRQAAVHALSFSPLRPDMWLFLASLQKTADTASDAFLQMAYLTGPGRRDDLITRLFQSFRSPSLAKPELKDLVTIDIAYVLNRDTSLRPVVMQAYREAPPANRPALRAILQTIDPAFNF